MLAHFIEEEGVATTQVSLIRIHTEKTNPPRALWVPFELGRPLGIPDNPAFQKRVLLAALKLFESPNGPVIEDYPEDAPVVESKAIVLACPVDFPRGTIDLNETQQLCTAFKREFASLHPWYAIAFKNRGRTTVTNSDTLDTIPDFLCSLLEGNVPENTSESISLPYALILIANDLKSYYCEAITAQPDQASIENVALLDWFWEETVAGKVLLAIKKTSKNSADPLLQLVGSMLIVPAKVKH